MSTPSATVSDFHKTVIDGRLDALDQALVGVMPRQERLQWVSQIESRLCELAACSSVPLPTDSSLSGTTPRMAAPDHSGLPVVSNWNSAPQSAFANQMLAPQQKKRSRLAVWSAACGIAAMVLTVGLPITYLVLTMVSEMLGEILTLSILGIHAVSVGSLGFLAMALAVLALVALRRRSGQLTGRGWAFTGLLTGPIPAFASIAAGLVLLVEMGGVTTITVSQPIAGDFEVPTSPTPTAYLPQAAGDPSVMPVQSLYLHDAERQPRSLVPSPSAVPPLANPASEAKVESTSPNESPSELPQRNLPTSSPATPEQIIPASEPEASPIDAVDMPESAPGI